MFQFEIARIPVGVHWMFLLISGLLGGALSADSAGEWADVGLWVMVVLVSVLIHELGHAFMLRSFGEPSEIVLQGFGGATMYRGGKLTRRQSIYVSAAGPAAGLFLGLTVLAVRFFAPVGHQGVDTALAYGLWVNFFWTFINLLPIQPMDGGQILRELLGSARVKITSMIGTAVGVGMGVLALNYGLTYLAFMLFYFAYLNYTNSANDGGVIPR